MSGGTRRDFLAGLAAAAVLPGRAWAALTANIPPARDLDLIASYLELVRREAWVAGPAQADRMKPAGAYDRITLHHAGNLPSFETDRAAVQYQLKGIRQDHMDRQFGDIGYHFVIDHGGRVWEGRPLAYEGAHVASQNEGNIGVMLLGNFEEQEPSQAQLVAMARVVYLLRRSYRIKRHRIFGHRDLGPSVCPGAHLYPYVLRMRA